MSGRILHAEYVYVCVCVSLGTVPQGPLQPAPDGCSAAASARATEPLRSGQSGAPQGAHTAGLLPLRTGRVQGNYAQKHTHVFTQPVNSNRRQG